MSIKPILMNAEMVRALLDGRKTVTRLGGESVGMGDRIRTLREAK